MCSMCQVQLFNSFTSCGNNYYPLKNKRKEQKIDDFYKIT